MTLHSLFSIKSVAILFASSDTDLQKSTRFCDRWEPTGAISLRLITASWTRLMSLNGCFLTYLLTDNKLVELAHIFYAELTILETGLEQAYCDAVVPCNSRPPLRKFHISIKILWCRFDCGISMNDSIS